MLYLSLVSGPIPFDGFIIVILQLAEPALQQP